ncbi:unnamed protein product, partial [Oppiella nova]
ANSALNISSVLTSGHTTAAITCNGLTAHTNDVSFIAHQSNRVSITNITVGHYQAVNTFTYGDRTIHESGVVYGGPCDSSLFWGMSIFEHGQPNACNGTNGVITSTAIYRIWTLAGSCNSMCLVNSPANLGYSAYTLSPPVNNNGLVNMTTK